MQRSGHRIEIDPARSFMSVTLWGDWANAQTDGLSVDHAKAVAAMKAAGVRHGDFLTLVDMRHKTLTEQNTIIEFRKSFDAGSPSKRTAIIVPNDMSTSMAEKIDPIGRVRIVYNEKDAISWLYPSQSNLE